MTKMVFGAEEYILSIIKDWRISIGKAAEMLNTSVYDMYCIAQKHGIHLGATQEQAEKSRETPQREC